MFCNVINDKCIFQPEEIQIFYDIVLGCKVGVFVRNIESKFILTQELNVDCIGIIYIRQRFINKPAYFELSIGSNSRPHCRFRRRRALCIPYKRAQDTDICCRYLESAQMPNTTRNQPSQPRSGVYSNKRGLLPVHHPRRNIPRLIEICGRPRCTNLNTFPPIVYIQSLWKYRRAGQYHTEAAVHRCSYPHQ